MESTSRPIAVDLSSLNHTSELSKKLGISTYTDNSKNISAKESETLQNAKTKLELEGDVYQYRGVNFEPLELSELKREKIDIDSLNLSQKTSTSQQNDDRVIVAFRDPKNPEKIIAYKLDKEIVKELQDSFSTKDFFGREDGILRLNGKAEKYIAGWVLDIQENRGYTKADANGNGKIELEEEKNLTISISRKSDYDYLEYKILEARSSAENSYNSLGKKYDRSGKELITSSFGDSIYRTKNLKFELTVEDELAHTIQMDKNKDGIVSLKEGLEEFVPDGKTLKEYYTQEVANAHKKWVEFNDIKLEPNKIQSRFFIHNSSNLTDEQQKILEKLQNDYFANFSVEQTIKNEEKTIKEIYEQKNDT